MQCKVDGCPRDTYTGSELCKTHYSAVSAALQAETQATREHEERSGADTRFVTLCERLLAMGATEVQVGSRRAVFGRPAPQLQDLPSPPRGAKAETRTQREDRMRREEDERRARELRSVGGG